MNLEQIDTSTTAGKAEVIKEPAPNWCRTCDRLWRDPFAALVCPDAIHRRADRAGEKGQ